MQRFRAGPCRLMLLILVCGWVTGAAAEAPRAELTVDALARHIDALWRGSTSHAAMTMRVKTHRYERVMQLEAWSQGKAHSLIIIRSPLKDKGIATLKVGANIWNYLPKINRVTKVPASMMSGAWMGSHFTNDDLVKESTFEEDYHASLERHGERLKLTFLPKPNAVVVWGKVEMWLMSSTWVPVEALYYDEDLEKVRTLAFSHVERIGDRDVPLRMTLVPVAEPDEFTELIYSDLQFDVSIAPELFSLQTLKRTR